MTALHLHIKAVDTLMFRDGRPFNQNDAGASEAASVFPPYPPTIVGAVRAALWQGPLKGTWEIDKLGTGTNWQEKNKVNYLTPLFLGAPLILKNGAPVFPVPLHILQASNGDITRLKPGNDLQCDLGNVKLPVPVDPLLKGVKLMDDMWVNMDGMKKILNGGVPGKSDMIERTGLWDFEPRVGHRYRR